MQKKTESTDGYSALQVGFLAKKTHRVSKPMMGHFKKADQGAFTCLRELAADNVDDYQVGDQITCEAVFKPGDIVDVTGTGKGKGFQGGVKRHNFQMQDATHGNSISHRAIGSTGQCQEPGRVFKGKKMAGHMGDEQVTEECLEIIRVDSERNLLLVKGAIPGSKSGFVKVMLSAKKDKINSNISKQIQEQKDAQLAQEQEAKAAAEAEIAAAKEAKKVTSEANTTKDDSAETPKVETE